MTHTPTLDRRLDAVRLLARVLDDAVTIPGTRWRIGLDALIGLVPGVGDVVGGALSGYVLLTAARLGAPRAVLLRMLFNVLVDSLVGAVPLLGDLFDVAWKANARNVALLQRHIDDPRGARAASRGVVALILVGLVMIVVAGLAAAVMLVRGLLGLVG